MKDKSKQIWNLYKKNEKQLVIECFNILSEFYVHLGHKSEAEIVNALNKIFVEDLITRYSFMEIEEVRFAIHKGIKDNDPPLFVNVPTWNKFLRDYRKSEQYRRQSNAIEEYTIYKKRMEGFGKALKNREVKKIGK
tara:strand:+ start:1471 stop:1878 length:408 start_codon:yes stop_codon:yes gene_type:complete